MKRLSCIKECVHVPLHVYQNRRDQLKAMMSENSLAIISRRESIRNRDAEYPFRQSSDFWYLTGFTEPDAVLIIGPGHPDRLFVRPKNPDQRSGQVGDSDLITSKRAWESMRDINRRIGCRIHNFIG